MHRQLSIYLSLLHSCCRDNGQIQQQNQREISLFSFSNIYNMENKFRKPSNALATIIIQLSILNPFVAPFRLFACTTTAAMQQPREITVVTKVLRRNAGR